MFRFKLCMCVVSGAEKVMVLYQACIFFFLNGLDYFVFKYLTYEWFNVVESVPVSFQTRHACCARSSSFIKLFREFFYNVYKNVEICLVVDKKDLLDH